MKRGPSSSWQILLWLTAFALPGLRADIYTVRREGANLVPLRSVDISMEAEEVVIEEVADGPGGDRELWATATFFMRNQSTTAVETLVAFPILGSGYAAEAKPSPQFTVETGSEAEPGRFQTLPAAWHPHGKQVTKADVFAGPTPAEIDGYAGSMVWPMRWTANEMKVIRVKFGMGRPKFLPGTNPLGDGLQVTYIVSTGARWKGSIGRADITIRFPPDGMRNFAGVPFSPDSVQLCSYPGQATWEGRHSVSWHFEQWVPTEEMWVRAVEWHGFKGEGSRPYGFVLPPYQGDKVRYTPAFLAGLLDEELALGRRYFPEKVKLMDVRLVERGIADWLWHEIYARHGDPFFVGTRGPREKLPAEVEAGQTHDEPGDEGLYSAWREAFRRYEGIRGWYRPGRPTGGKFPAIHLRGIEQENAAFLEKTLAGLQTSAPARDEGKLDSHAHLPGKTAP